jgi:hypothetical protein
MNQEPFEIAAKQENSIFINGSVRPRTIPANHYTMLHVYWLAFRNCVYSKERLSQLPFGFIYGEREGATIPAVYKYDKTSPTDKVVEEISFLNPGLLYTTTGDNYPLEAPYDKGYVIGRFKVLERRNIGSLSIPIRFEWHVYSPKSGSVSSNDLDVIYFVRGKVSKLLSFDKDFSAVLRGPEDLKMVVVDYRVQKESEAPGGYYLTRGRFLHPHEAEYREEVNRLRRMPRS